MKHAADQLILFKKTLLNRFLFFGFCSYLLLVVLQSTASAQDLLYTRNVVKCKVMKATDSSYIIAYLDSNKNVIVTEIVRKTVDSVKYKQYPADSTILAAADTSKKETPVKDEPKEKIPGPWRFKFAINLNCDYTSEINPSSGPNTKSFSLTGGIDLGLNYKKSSSRLVMTNEAHWLFGLQQPVTDTSHLQRVTDNLKTLHDYSYALSKNSKFSFNVISKTTTSIFTIYNGDYFKDYNHLGQTQAFLSPYDVSLAPGVKLEPDKYLRISVSPYSMDFYGLRSQEIANTGLYTHDSGANHQMITYKQKELGAAVNIWYDRKISKWLDMQYRISITSDHLDKISKNGLVDGLFITKVRLIKDLYLSHRATLKSDFSQASVKPDFKQTILLSYSKSL